MGYTRTHTHTGIVSHKKGNPATCVTTWMSLQDVLLCEISQMEKDSYRMIWKKKVRLRETEGRMMISRSWGQGHGQMWVREYNLHLKDV